MDPEPMDSQEHPLAESQAPEVSLPTTPQLQSAQSPIENSDSNAIINHTSASNGAAARKTPPTTASITTPPPSSQLAQHRTMARTPTPPSPHLSSPPPTNIITKQAGPISEGTGAMFTSQQIASASPDDLRLMIDDLSTALKDAKMTAAHHKLQYNMLRMESTEAQNRYEVELAMREREVDTIRYAAAEERQRSQHLPPATDPGLASANAILISELNRQVSGLQDENASLSHRLLDATRALEDRDSLLREEREKTKGLQRQIRKNREHVNSMLETPFDGSPTRSVLGTPITPRNRRQNEHASSHHGHARDQQPFEALLLADKIISQENNNATAPSTPTRGPQRGRYGHTRGVQSLSSVPSTPTNRTGRYTQQQQYGGILATPPNRQLFAQIPMSAPHAHAHAHAQPYLSHQQNQQQSHHQRGRRTSSASTITASSIGGGDSDDNEGDAIPESQASRAASSILRATPTSKSFETAQKSGGLVQSKILGQVRKPSGGSKGSVAASPSKKRRVADGVGLGIGGVAR